MPEQRVPRFRSEPEGEHLGRVYTTSLGLLSAYNRALGLWVAEFVRVYEKRNEKIDFTECLFGNSCSEYSSLHSSWAKRLLD